MAPIYIPRKVYDVELVVPMRGDYLIETITKLSSTIFPSFCQDSMWRDRVVEIYKKDDTPVQRSFIDLSPSEICEFFKSLPFSQDVIFLSKNKMDLNLYFNLLTSLEKMDFFDKCYKFNVWDGVFSLLNLDDLDSKFLEHSVDIAIMNNDLEVLEEIFDHPNANNDLMGYALAQSAKFNNVKAVNFILLMEKAADIKPRWVQEAILNIYNSKTSSESLKLILLLPQVKDIEPSIFKDLILFCVLFNDIEAIHLILQKIKSEDLNFDILGKAFSQSIVDNNYQILIIIANKLGFIDIDKVAKQDSSKISLKLASDNLANLGVLLAFAATNNDTKVITEILRNPKADQLDSYFLKIAILEFIRYDNSDCIELILKNFNFMKMLMDHMQSFYDYAQNQGHEKIANMIKRSFS